MDSKPALAAATDALIQAAKAVAAALPSATPADLAAYYARMQASTHDEHRSALAFFASRS